MTLGSIIGGLVRAGGTVLPAYVGAMFVAVIFRNLNDKLKFIELDFYTIDLIGIPNIIYFINAFKWEIQKISMFLNCYKN